MACVNKCEHFWSRLSMVSTNQSIGSRDIVSCNNCLAIKIVFETYQDGEWKTEIVIAEPSNQ